MKLPVNNKTLNAHETRLANHYAYNATYARHISLLGQRKWGIIPSPKSGGTYPPISLLRRLWRHATDRQTDGQTDTAHHFMFYGGRGIKFKLFCRGRQTVCQLSRLQTIDSTLSHLFLIWDEKRQSVTEVSCWECRAPQYSWQGRFPLTELQRCYF